MIATFFDLDSDIEESQKSLLLKGVKNTSVLDPQDSTQTSPISAMCLETVAWSKTEGWSLY